MMLRTSLVKTAHQRKYIVLMGCLSIYLNFQYGNASPPRHCTSFIFHEYPPSGTPRTFPQVKKREMREEFLMEFPLDNVLDIVESIQATERRRYTLLTMLWTIITLYTISIAQMK
jgi:hypothetical protein